MYYFNYYKYNTNLSFVKRHREKNEKNFIKIEREKTSIFLVGFFEGWWTPNNEKLLRSHLQSYPSIEPLPGQSVF